MGFSNLSKFPEMHTGFQILRCTKFDIPNSSGKYQKPRIHLSLEFDFYFGNSCDADKSTLYVTGSPYMVHSCACDVIWWMAKHCCQVRAGLGPRLQRHKCQVRAGLGLRLLWVKVTVVTSSVAYITFVEAEITFKIVVITSLVAKITFLVAEISFKVTVIASSVANITFVVAEITFKVVAITSLVAKITFVVAEIAF